MLATASWKIFPFSEVVDILDSRRIPVNGEERAKRVGDVPYYGATGQVGVIDKHIFDEELVLLGEDGAPFLDSGKPKAYLIRGKSWVNNHAHVLRGKPGLLNSFLLYQLNNLDYSPYVSGTTRLKLPQGPMKQIPLLVPAEDEQRRIVAEIEKQFTRLEAGVAALRRAQANLKRYRAAVLKAACEGRLVPIEVELAKAGIRKAKFETGEALLARILTERRQNWRGRGRYKEPAAPDIDNLPPLPDGWVVASVDQLCGHITSGSRDWSQFYSRGTGTFILAQNVRAMRLDLRERQSVDAPKGDAETERTRVHRNDILVTIVGAKTGDVCRVPSDLEDHFVCQSVALFRPVLSDFSKFVELYLASQENGQAQWKRYIYGQGRPHLSFEQLRMTALPFPPLAEQERIVAEVERRLSVVEELETVVSANLRRATRLRQAILQKAFTGELMAI